MPEDKAFIDTNILIYAYNKTYPEKRQKAQEEIDKYNSVISTQVINEFCNSSLYKLRKTHDEIMVAIQELRENHTVAQVYIETITKALLLQEKYQFNYYDCIMLASALEHGCKFIFSEDMQHEQVIDNKLTILNPFKL